MESIKIITLLMGSIYPAYSTYRSLRWRSQKDSILWQIYWIVFAIYTFIEYFADKLVWWFPFYSELKMLFLLWLLPTVGAGCASVYRSYLVPLLRRNQPVLDEGVAVLCHKFGIAGRECMQLLYNLLIVTAERVQMLHCNDELNLSDNVLSGLEEFLRHNAERILSQQNPQTQPQIEENQQLQLLPDVVKEVTNNGDENDSENSSNSLMAIGTDANVIQNGNDDGFDHRVVHHNEQANKQQNNVSHVSTTDIIRIPSECFEQERRRIHTQIRRAELNIQNSWNTWKKAYITQNSKFRCNHSE